MSGKPSSANNNNKNKRARSTKKDKDVQKPVEKKGKKEQVECGICGGRTYGLKCNGMFHFTCPDCKIEKSKLGGNQSFTGQCTDCRKAEKAKGVNGIVKLEQQRQQKLADEMSTIEKKKKGKDQEKPTEKNKSKPLLECMHCHGSDQDYLYADPFNDYNIYICAKCRNSDNSGDICEVCGGDLPSDCADFHVTCEKCSIVTSSVWADERFWCDACRCTGTGNDKLTKLGLRTAIVASVEKVVKKKKKEEEKKEAEEARLKQEMKDAMLASIADDMKDASKNLKDAREEYRVAKSAYQDADFTLGELEKRLEDAKKNGTIGPQSSFERRHGVRRDHQLSLYKSMVEDGVYPAQKSAHQHNLVDLFTNSSNIHDAYSNSFKMPKPELLNTRYDILTEPTDEDMESY